MVLEEYVRLGGTVLVLAQQYGEDIDGVVPVPEGQSLRSYGWREDQSCLRNSAYGEGLHPVLSSTRKDILSIGVDGYFSTIPTNSSVLIRRAVNHQPALISYPYGEGTVILTSMFTDWAHAHGQASKEE